jgi:hypothetical protein
MHGMCTNNVMSLLVSAGNSSNHALKLTARQFKPCFEAHCKAFKKKQEQSEKEELAFQHDRLLHPCDETHDSRGRLMFSRHPAKDLLSHDYTFVHSYVTLEFTSRVQAIQVEGVYAMHLLRAPPQQVYQLEQNKKRAVWRTLLINWSNKKHAVWRTL